MNKDLEKEYKELMTEDVPDLWGRIEAGLESKESAAKVSFLRKYRTLGMAAAACLCLAVVGPMIYSGISGDSASKADSGGAAYAPSIMDSASDGGMDGNMGWDNFSPGVNYEPEWEDVNSAGEAPNDGYDYEFCIITATVTEVLEEEGKNVYLVQMVEADRADWSQGDIIKLYELGQADEKLTVGETYLFDILISETDDGVEEYFIYDYWSE